MALFDVPGWSVPSVPARSHEKRKRPTDGEGKSQAAVINFDKLVKKLGTDRPVSEDSASTKPARQPKQRRRISDDGQRALSPETSLDTAIQKPEPRPTGVNPENTPGGGRKERKRKHKPTREADRNGAPKGNAVKEESPLRPSRPPTKMGRKSKPDEHNSPAAPPPSTVPKEHETVEKVGLTLLQKGMKHSLDGARFRWINELLYKSDSAQAHQMMKNEPSTYEEYHTGFRRQVNSWPTNPVSHYISKFTSYPPKTIIADLGCGEAALARALLPHSIAVLSFDLVSDGVYTVEADICARVPLPGSEGSVGEKGEGEGAIVDVVVCALSLMGTNWVRCILEAWRILKPGGELHIAEVASRFTDVNSFVSLVCTVGFRLVSKDDENTHFTLFEFRKVSRKGRSEQDWARVIERGAVLKPCEYKRR